MTWWVLRRSQSAKVLGEWYCGPHDPWIQPALHHMTRHRRDATRYSSAEAAAAATMRADDGTYSVVEIQEED